MFNARILIKQIQISDLSYRVLIYRVMRLNGYCYSHEFYSIVIALSQGVSVSHFFLEKQYIFLIFLSCKKISSGPRSFALIDKRMQL